MTERINKAAVIAVPEVTPPESNEPAVVTRWARGVMDGFGLRDWSFGFDNAKRRLGCCDYRNLRITLSRYFLALGDLAEIRETLLHEIAHALVGRGHAHGPVWREMARRIGAKPVPCGNADMPEGRIVATCGGCSRRFHRHKRPGKGMKYWCKRCGPERGLLAWTTPREG